MSANKRLIFYTILVAFVLLVIGTAIELTARLIFKDHQFTVHNQATVFQHDEIIGWKGIPGYDGIPRPEFGARVSINSHGFRDSDWVKKLEAAEQNNRKKILFAGGSVLYGARINKENRVTEQLAERFKEEGQEVEVFNAGVPGFGTSQEFRTLMQLWPEIRPDIVVLSFSDNDIGESSLPYNPRHKRRVYKPYYDLAGNLSLNESVPKRFSYSIQDTFIARFRSKYFIDAVQKIWDGYVYRKHGIPENREIRLRHPIQERWYRFRHSFDFDSMFNLYQLKDLYSKHSQRNIALIEKLNEHAKASDARFMVLLNMTTGDDAMDSEKDFLKRLAEKGITTVNFHGLLQGYEPWRYVNRDGHPNFLENYIRATALYRQMQDPEAEVVPQNARWYRNIPSSIDFTEPRFERFLFGQWHEREHGDPKDSLWMGDSARVMLRPRGEEKRVRITIKGETRFKGENTSPYTLGGTHANTVTLLDNGMPFAQRTVPDQGPFSIEATHEVRNGLLLLNIVSSRAFRPNISGVSPDERQLSLLVSSISLAPVDSNN